MATDTEIQSVPLLDISRENGPLEQEIQAAIADVCRSGRFVLGPECERLETSLADYCGADHGVGCASGSDALLLALMAFGIGEGDEVIVPSFTFFATASAVSRLGAKPVFVDIDPNTFNIDPHRVEKAITSATRAIIPVHLFGQCAEMSPINELAGRFGLAVIEDACQAIGAKYHDMPAGSLGDIGCFSFYPTKNLGSFGDAGATTTNDKELADNLRLLRGHGMRPRYYHQVVGVNSRLDSIQATVLNIKLTHLDRWTQMRRANAARYERLFTNADLASKIGLPSEESGQYHVWNQYTIRVPGGQRHALREHLRAANIGTEVYYPVALHQQDCFKSLGYLPGSLPVTERASQEVLSLPIFPHLSEAEQDAVVATIAQFVEANPVSSHVLKGPNFLVHRTHRAPQADAAK